MNQHPIDEVSVMKWVVSTVEELLGGEVELNPASNFFEAGGDSLTGVLLTYSVAEEFSLEIELEELFDFEELGELARWISARAPARNVVTPTRE